MLRNGSSTWHRLHLDHAGLPFSRLKIDRARPQDADFEAVMASVANAVRASAVFVSVHSDSTKATPTIVPCAGTEAFNPALLLEIAAQAAPGRVFGYSAAGSRLDWSETAIGTTRWEILRTAVHAPQAGKTAVVHILFDSADAPARSEVEVPFRALQVLLAAFLAQWLRDADERRTLPGFQAALNGLDFGVILLDTDERIIFANEVGGDFLTEGVHVRRSGAMLSATNLRDAYALQVSIRDAIDAPGRAGGMAGTAPVLTLGSGRADRPVFASILPASSSVARPGQVAVIVYLHDPQLDISAKLPPVCKLYGLSPVETKFVTLLVGGACLRDASVVLRIKEQTARSYLKQIFLKTSTRRQADLVRLMLCSIMHTNCELRPLLLDAFTSFGGSDASRLEVPASRDGGRLTPS